jgi:hypothetical protein
VFDSYRLILHCSNFPAHLDIQTPRTMPKRKVEAASSTAHAPKRPRGRPPGPSKPSKTQGSSNAHRGRGTSPLYLTRLRTSTVTFTIPAEIHLVMVEQRTEDIGKSETITIDVKGVYTSVQRANAAAWAMLRHEAFLYEVDLNGLLDDAHEAVDSRGLFDYTLDTDDTEIGLLYTRAFVQKQELDLDSDTPSPLASPAGNRGRTEDGKSVAYSDGESESESEESGEASPVYTI